MSQYTFMDDFTPCHGFYFLDQAANMNG